MRIIVGIATLALCGIAGLATAQAGERDVITTHSAAVEAIGPDIVRFAGKEWRIANIEAPQPDASCNEEKAFGATAHAKLVELLAGDGKLEIMPTGGHDMEQRETALIHLNGNDVGERMISAGVAAKRGHGRPYCFAEILDGDAVEPGASNVSGTGIARMHIDHPFIRPGR